MLFVILRDQHGRAYRKSYTMASVTDVERIRRLLAEYCRFLDDRRYAEFGQLFAPDGVWRMGGRAHHGPTEVQAFMDQLLLDHPDRRSLHMHTNVAIDVDGDTARSTSDYTMLTRTGSAPWQVLGMGRYVDRLIRHADDSWRFAERTLER